MKIIWENVFSGKVRSENMSQYIVGIDGNI